MGKTESVESGKDNGPLLAWIDSECGHVVNEIKGKRWHRANATRTRYERETLASNQRNPRNGIKGSVGIEPTQPGSGKGLSLLILLTSISHLLTITLRSSEGAKGKRAKPEKI
jgi:hypothetical protein